MDATMADVSSDPYEQKLYQMFSSHDAAATGSLDRSALRQLCHTLDLKDREAVLVEACLRNAEPCTGRVTFRGFKDGLLTLLGDGSGSAPSGADEAIASDPHLPPYAFASSATVSSTADAASASATLPDTTTTTTTISSSPSREVSPKFVVAGKKYGRRSRPASGAFEDMSSTDSDASGDGDDAAVSRHPTAAAAKLAQKVQRSSSHSELHGEPRKRRPTAGTKLKRCASLPAQPKPPRRSGDAHSNGGAAVAAGASQPMMRESSVESLGNLDFENLSRSLYDLWLDCGRATDNQLNRAQLEHVCEQVGLHARIARKVAEEVFEKLGLSGPNGDDDDVDQRVSFADFIALIQGDGDAATPSAVGSTLLDASASSTSSLGALRSVASQPQLRGVNDDFLSGGVVVVGSGDGGGADSGLGSVCKESTDTLLSSSVAMMMLIGGQEEMLMGQHGGAGDWPVESSAVPAEVIVDMWDTAGIANPRSLLDQLGFRSKEIRISQLSLAIEDDLQSMPEPTAASTATAVSTSGNPEATDHSVQSLLRASLALHKAEVNALQIAFRQLAAQNRKLHASNRDTNRRAALLAHEVDERHTHLEQSARKEIEALEQRHAETVRDLTAQLTADREHLTAYTAQLEQRQRTAEADEARLRLQCQLATAENSTLESELIAVQRQCTDLLEENIRLNNTIVEVDERQRCDETRRGDRESEELLELMEKVSGLQLENAALRDRNDELCSDMEEQLVELTRLRGKKTVAARSDADSTDGAAADGASNASATKRRGDSPSKAKISEESPKLGKLRKCSNESDEGAAAAAADQSDGQSGEWMALNAELRQSAKGSTAANKDDDDDNTIEGDGTNSAAVVLALRQRIADLQQRLDQSSVDPDARVTELEQSLEQMRKEFEDLEDYWQGKLTEERQLYEQDQLKSGEKFDELLKKLGEYEEQFVDKTAAAAATSGRLSPIEERDVLEQQYLELEDELEEMREQARTVLDARDAEISTLQEKLKRVQHRLVESAAAVSAASTPPAAVASTSAATAANQLPVANEMPSLGGISCRSLDADSPASSPISYLWTQSTIQAPVRDYQNPNWGSRPPAVATIADSTPAGAAAAVATVAASPIQRPGTPSQQSAHSGGTGPDDRRGDSASDTSSVRSYGSPSVASTFNIRSPSVAGDAAGAAAGAAHPAQLRDEAKRLKLLELKLRHDVQELCAQRDRVVVELQQLHEFRPAVERSAAYARSNHPSLMQRNAALEQRVRALELCLKNQHQYNETMMQQTCVQHNSVVGVLHARLVEQQVLINEQAARLVNNDLFAKDMFVENSQLGDLLEQQRMCNTRLRQHHQQI